MEGKGVLGAKDLEEEEEGRKGGAGGKNQSRCGGGGGDGEWSGSRGILGIPALRSGGKARDVLFFLFFDEMEGMSLGFVRLPHVRLGGIIPPLSLTCRPRN